MKQVFSIIVLFLVLAAGSVYAQEVVQEVRVTQATTCVAPTQGIYLVVKPGRNVHQDAVVNDFVGRITQQSGYPVYVVSAAPPNSPNTIVMDLRVATLMLSSRVLNGIQQAKGRENTRMRKEAIDGIGRILSPRGRISGPIGRTVKRREQIDADFRALENCENFNCQEQKWQVTIPVRYFDGYGRDLESFRPGDPYHLFKTLDKNVKGEHTYMLLAQGDTFWKPLEVANSEPLQFNLKRQVELLGMLAAWDSVTLRLNCAAQRMQETAPAQQAVQPVQKAASAQKPWKLKHNYADEPAEKVGQGQCKNCRPRN